MVSNKEIDTDVLVAVEYLENADIYAFPKTIASFLMGKTTSPHYDSVYKKHKDICGLYTSISEETVSESLARLHRSGYLDRTLTSKGKYLYTMKAHPVRKNTKETIKKTPTKGRNFKCNTEYRFYENGQKCHAKIQKDGNKYSIEVFRPKSKAIVNIYGSLTKEEAGKILAQHNTKDSYTEFVKNAKTPKIKKEPKTKEPREEQKPFFEAANSSERSVLLEFRTLVNELLPDYELQEDNPSLYGFYNKSITEIGKNGKPYFPKRCWISRDKKTRKLNLHYKEKVNSSEKVLPLTTSAKREEAWRKLRIAYNTKTITEVRTIVERIKNHDEFNTYVTANNIDVSLMPHQKAGVELAAKYNKFAFFYDTGTGKTIMSLEIMMNKYVQKKAKFLVVAPKALIKSAWLDDSKHFKNMKILPLSKNMSTEDYARLYDYWQVMDGYERAFTDEDGNLLEKVPKKLLEDIMPLLYAKAHHFIINMQLITKPKDCEELLEKTKCTGMIIDESVMIKNFYSESSKTARRFAGYMDYVYILSGKPAPNNISEYYSQMTIVDPKTFPVNGYPAFIKEYFITKEFRGSTKIERPKAGAYEKIGKMVDNRSITVSKEDCIKLPEKFEQIRSVEVDSATMNFYEDVLNNFVAEVKTMAGQTLRTRQMAKIATIMKLREIASGFYLDSSTNTWRINDHKVQAIKDLIDEIGYDSTGKRNKVLIWCTFKFEIESLQEALSKDYKVGVAYSKTKDIYEVCNAFQKGDLEILIAHPQTLKYGVTLTSCHYCIYSSMSYSYDDYYQSESRIIRKGQENLCMFYFMQSEDTIDETIYKCVTEKGRNAKIFERIIKSISKHGYNKEQINSLLSVPMEVKYAVTNDNDINGYSGA